MKFHDVCVVSVSVATTKSQFTLYLLLMIASKIYSGGVEEESSGLEQLPLVFLLFFLNVTTYYAAT